MLLEAVAKFRDEIPDVRLLVIGDELDDELGKVIDDLDLSDTVDWIDYVENQDLPAYYRGADLARFRPGKKG